MIITKLNRSPCTLGYGAGKKATGVVKRCSPIDLVVVIQSAISIIRLFCSPVDKEIRG